MNKMKKLLMAVGAFGMLFTSCQNDLDFVPNVDETSTVSFQIGTPEIATRAYSDGMTATVLQYAVYDSDGNILSDLTKTNATINGSTTVNLQLTTGDSYAVIFWAAAEGAPYTVDFDKKTMTVSYDNAQSNDEARDAFYKYHTFTVTGAQTETIELKRPFAQLNIGTNDFGASESAGYVPTTSAVTVKNIYNTLNLVDGAATGETQAVFEANTIPEGEQFPVSGYEYLAMNYLLVNSEKEVVDVEFTYADANNDAKTRTVGSVPVQRNHRTNIYGQLLTSDVNINVEIKPEYDDEYLEDWDGKTLNEPTFDATTKTYYISHAAELAYIAQLVNGTLDTDNVTRAVVDANSLKGYTVKLECDINLNGKEWTPIGNKTNKFQGVFDGNNQTIKNLVITSGSSYVGLFGFTTDGEIKNLTVENAKVKGYTEVGVVAGSPYTSKYANITVKGHVEVNGLSYVGAVGGKNAYASWNNITVDVDADSYVNANSVEDGKAYRSYVGGVIGSMGEGGHTISNVTSNIDVKGSTCDVGGIVGIAHYGNNFVNVTCNADVEIYSADDEDEAQEIGGIAGVWMNSNANSPVTFKNCKFNGELKANNGYVINTDKFTNRVCAAYNSNGPGKLIIDGVEYMQTENGVTINGAVVAADSEDMVAALEKGLDVVLVNDVKIDPAEMSNAYGATGINVKYGQTIDGGGHILDIKGAGGTWDSGINTTGGLIKNITVTGSFRGIFINHNSDHSEPVVLQDVIIDGTTYTISCDQGKNQNFEAYNSTFNGWTSYAATIGTAKFEGCSFGEGNGYAYCRPYAPTTFTNCEFEKGFKMDCRAACTFENCMLDGVLLTAENIATLVTSNTVNATVK